MTPRDPLNPFALDLERKSGWQWSLFRFVRPLLEHFFGLDEMARIYRRLQENSGQDRREFLTRVMEVLQVSYAISADDFERIPKVGRVLVVANHPFGGLEGMILAAILRAVRPDVKIMANFLLSRVPELHDLFIFVNPFGGAEAVRQNLIGLRESIDWLRNGRMLGVFPAGAVSHLHWSEGEIRDPEWSVTVARVIRKTESPVLPLFFHGRNGVLFQLAGFIHPLLRTALLPREFRKRWNSTIEVTIGSLIPYEKLSSFEDDTEMLAYIRMRTYILGRANGQGNTVRSSWIFFRRRRRLAPLVEPRDQGEIAREVAAIPADQVLLESGEYKVFHATADQIPIVLEEIGRLRELSFRRVNEGTGKPTDLDEFDKYYVHLFVWNKNKGEIVGAYRIGHTDEILKERGKEGLYTSTLFNYRAGLLEELGPALELGRSFVRPEYQRNYSPLLLLWKGIGRYVVKHKQYKILFGPVSINNDYDSLSRDIIVNFLQANNFLPEMAKLVTPRNPHRVRPVPEGDPRSSSIVVRNVDEVNELVAEIESDRRGIPVLLRQYLKLGGKLLGFNVDHNFGDVLDGLILVDLTQTDVRLLERYIGKEEAREFLEFHRDRQNVDGGTKVIPASFSRDSMRGRKG